MTRGSLAAVWNGSKWPVFIAGFLLASLYAVGGPRLFRFRARAAALLEPPTDAEMQRAADTLAQSVSPAVIPGNEPASLALMLGATMIVVLAILLLLFVSTRWKH